MYIIQSSLSLAAFYLFYKLLCSRDTLHRFNRMLLLFILALSAVIPFIHIDLAIASQETNVLFEELTMNIEPSGVVTSEVVTTKKAAPTPWQQIPWRSVLIGCYLLGLTVYLVRFTSSLLSIVRLIRKSQRQELPDGTTLITHDKAYGPFSWMRYIIVSAQDLHDNRDMILAHERAHIRLGHSWDLLFAQLCATAQWFNPAAWLLKRELEAIHEYEADNYTLRQGFEARQYQLRLFEAATGVKFNTITNNFNNCSTKKRIIMMMKKQTSPWARMKALFVIPVAFAAVALISCTSPKEKSYPIRIGRNNVTEYNISDFGPHPAVMITKQHNGRGNGQSQKVTMQGVYVSHALEAFLNGGDERKEFLAGCNVTEADIDSVRIFFPGESDLCGNIGDNGILAIYLKRYVKGLQSYKENKKPSNITVGYDGENAPLLVIILSDGTEIFIVQNEGLQIFNKDSKAFLAHFNLSEFDIDEIDVMKPEEAKDAYGHHGIHGAVRLHVKRKSKEDIIDALRKLDTNETPLRVQIKSPSSAEANTHEVQAVGFGHKSETQEEQGEIYQVVEEQPEFPGGMDELMKFMQKNIKYPKEAQDRGLQGRVIVQFVINTDGSICEEEVVKSVDPQLDAEAIRLLRSMPNWEPGKQRGKAVRVRFTLPVTFRLS